MWYVVEEEKHIGRVQTDIHPYNIVKIGIGIGLIKKIIAYK